MFTVSGDVYQRGVYCGGAEPDPEELKEIEKPKAWPNKKLFIKKGKTNDLASTVLLEFTTDEKGGFSFVLPPGDYCVVDEYKVKKSNYNSLLKQFKKPTGSYGAVDKKCLETYFKTPDLIFTVSLTDIKGLVISYQERCSWLGPPCVEYKGSPPP